MPSLSSDVPDESGADIGLPGAGHRAAAQPVPAPPAIADIEHRAQRHRTRRRIAASGVTCLLIAAMAVPLTLATRSSTPVQTVSVAAAPPAASGVTGAALQEDGDSSQPDDADEPPPAPEDAPTDGETRIEVRLGPGIDIAVRVLEGDAAQQAADEAAAQADETMQPNGTEIWVRTEGERSTLSALVDGHFVEVTGPADHIDHLIAIVEDGGVELPPLPALPDFPGLPGGMHGDHGMDHEEIEEFLEDLGERLDERFEGFDGAPFADGERGFGFFFGDLDGEGPGFGFHHPDADGDGPRFDWFSGEPPDLERWLGDFDGELFERFGERFEEWPDGAEDLDELRSFLQDHFPLDGSHCFAVHIDGDNSFSFEHPEGCSTAE